MDEHFRLDVDPPTASSGHSPAAEQIGYTAAAILIFGAAALVALGMIALGIAAVRWAL